MVWPTAGRNVEGSIQKSCAQAARVENTAQQHAMSRTSRHFIADTCRISTLRRTMAIGFIGDKISEVEREPRETLPT